MHEGVCRAIRAAKNGASNDLHQPTHQALLNELDVQLWFSPVWASQGLWPAIDPPTSRSRLLASDAVTLDRRQVAQRVREILERYHEFHANRNNAPLGRSSGKY